MRVLQINSCCGCYSTGKIASDIAIELNGMGISNVVAFGRSFKDTGIKTVRIGTKTDYYIHAGMSRLIDCSGFMSKTATRKFIKWLEEYNPDIIHLHNVHGYYINIELLFNYLARTNKPVIWTLHDCWAFTGHCAYFDMAKCSKWKTGCQGKCPCKSDYPQSIISDSAHNWKAKRRLFTSVPNMTIVTPSEWLAKLVKQSFLKKYPVKVINNGIDKNIFKPTESDFREKNNLMDKKLLLGVAAVWDKRKGFEDFIKLSEMIDDNTRIVLVGLSKEQINKLPNNIIGIERTDSPQELAGIYTTADVFLNLTYEDNYPTVNLEAQACGTPVITYNTGGSVESVDSRFVVKNPDIVKIWNMIKKEKYNEYEIGTITKQEMIENYIMIYKSAF